MYTDRYLLAGGSASVVTLARGRSARTAAAWQRHHFPRPPLATVRLPTGSPRDGSPRRRTFCPQIAAEHPQNLSRTPRTEHKEHRPRRAAPRGFPAGPRGRGLRGNTKIGLATRFLCFCANRGRLAPLGTEYPQISTEHLQILGARRFTPNARQLQVWAAVVGREVVYPQPNHRRPDLQYPGIGGKPPLSLSDVSSDFYLPST